MRGGVPQAQLAGPIDCRPVTTHAADRRQGLAVGREGHRQDLTGFGLLEIGRTGIEVQRRLVRLARNRSRGGRPGGRLLQRLLRLSPRREQRQPERQQS